MVNEHKVFQIVGYKNTGKTTLICKLIARLTEKGLRVGTIKHDAHEFEIDDPKTDTWKHREAGAHTIAITSASRTAFIEERSTPLDVLVQKFHDIDIILVEGFKLEKYPKLVMVKKEGDLELVKQAHNVKGIVAWPSTTSLKSNIDQALPCFQLDDEQGILNLIAQQLNNFRNIMLP